MRLLNTQTLGLVEIIRPDQEDYAILSHTWGEEEVSLKALHKPESKQLLGYKKIERCCAQAHRDGYKYAWVDTCCIDKKSSADLSEAINSMYDWYDSARVCYVYLSDVSIDSIELLSRSRWFTRGWTLQELLASNEIRFYDRHWHYIGNKRDLAGSISIISGIEENYVRDKYSIREASVAARMSWASSRQTSRPEDEAYCLMGLFDVNMPLLYGEGGYKAFQRLQHEIANSSEDESLFAWHLSSFDLQEGIFAPRPAAFRGCGDIVAVDDPRIRRAPYGITNRGLSIDAPHQEVDFESLQGHSQLPEYPNPEFILLPLKCARKGDSIRGSGDDPGKLITVILRSISEGIFVRWLPGEIMVYEKYLHPKQDFCHRHIFIQPPSYTKYGERGYAVFAKFTEEGRSHRTRSLKDQWYITPPGYINRHLCLGFEGWTGFAVLQFHIPRTFSVIVRQVYTMSGKETCTLSLHDDSSELKAVVDSCYAQEGFLDLIPDGLEVEQLHIDEYGSVILRHVDSETYHLEFPPMQEYQVTEPTSLLQSNSLPTPPSIQSKQSQDIPQCRMPGPEAEHTISPHGGHSPENLNPLPHKTRLPMRWFAQMSKR
ncbi:MAG: hypothetical protein Q9171_007320 [Xanthocarpia ochracea]